MMGGNSATTVITTPPPDAWPFVTLPCGQRRADYDRDNPGCSQLQANGQTRMRIDCSGLDGVRRSQDRRGEFASRRCPLAVAELATP